MRDVEVKFNSFKLKKLVALTMCAVMAMGIMTMPVSAAEESNTPVPTGYTGDVSYTGDPSEAIDSIATGDAKDPSKVVDFIKNADSKSVIIGIHEETQTMPKSVFQAAKESGKELIFMSKDDSGNLIEFTFKDGITNDVDMNFGIKTSTDNELVKNLKDEGALVFEFAHNGVLPGPMEVRFYSEAYKDQTEATAFLYLLNEQTGKLEKQEQSVKVNYGWVSFTIVHCSSYVTTLTEIVETKLQVAEAKPEAKAPTPVKKDNAIKATGSDVVAFQTIALLALCGAVIVIASKKEKKVQ